jgi:HEAT repeats
LTIINCESKNGWRLAFGDSQANAKRKQNSEPQTLSRFLISLSVFIFPIIAGCGGKQEPARAYGQPVDHWLAELKKPDSKARKKAVQALGQIGQGDPKAIPALIEALKDQDSAVKEKAIVALLHIGPAASEAIPALTQAQNDPDPTIGAQAKKALEKIVKEP